MLAGAKSLLRRWIYVGWKMLESMKFPFGMTGMFRVYVSFRECNNSGVIISFHTCIAYTSIDVCQTTVVVSMFFLVALWEHNAT